MKEHELQVDEVSCRVMCSKTGKSTWTASGNFREKNIRETGRTESDAISQWRRHAEFVASE